MAQGSPSGKDPACPHYAGTERRPSAVVAFAPAQQRRGQTKQRLQARARRASYTALLCRFSASIPRENSALAPPQEHDPTNWHKFFGASANNEAWTLAELPAAEVDRKQLLNAAHAATWHWRQIGDELNRMRALMLLACAHAHAGLGESAMGFAEEMRAY